MATKPTKAAYVRWLEDNAGALIDTVQVRPDGSTWSPGERLLSRHGKRFKLDNSIAIEPDKSVTVIAIDDSSVSLETKFSDGRVWHTTTYTVKG